MIYNTIETQTSRDFSIFQHDNKYGNIEDFAAVGIIDCAQETDLNSVLKKTFEDLERESQTIEQDSGSTACISIVDKNQNGEVGFTIANLGDSGAALLIEKVDGTLLKIRLTEDHEPNLRRIKEEIESKGGIVANNRVYGTLAVGAALGDKIFRCLKKDPDIFSFKPGTDEYQALEAICTKERVDLQESIKNNKVRLVSFSDGIYVPRSILRCDYEVTLTEDNKVEFHQQI
jgi:serine/threonine protein phosphatase PrpC